MKVHDILKSLELLAPSSTAESWDNVGLLVGSRETLVKSAVVCIDLTEEAIEVALKQKATLILNHHPCIFPKARGLSQISDARAESRLVYAALTQEISVLACHTNFDRCALDALRDVAAGLGVEPQGRLHEISPQALKKLVVFVPDSHLEAVRESIFRAGAGEIGKYDQCSFSTKGQGTFRGGPGTQPYLGESGKLETVSESRLETVFPSGLQPLVLDALFATHPYEEVAWDIYPIEQPPSRLGFVKGLGYGFWGDYLTPKPFSEIAEDVKKVFQVKGFWVTEPLPKQVCRVAFVAGKGSSFLDAARRAGCDLFITGETGYHDAIKSARLGMTVIELGHRESEKYFLVTMKLWLEKLGVRVTEINSATQRIFTGEST